jgi:hypothetical protein
MLANARKVSKVNNSGFQVTVSGAWEDSSVVFIPPSRAECFELNRRMSLPAVRPQPQGNQTQQKTLPDYFVNTAAGSKPSVSVNAKKTSDPTDTHTTDGSDSISKETDSLILKRRRTSKGSTVTNSVSAHVDTDPNTHDDTESVLSHMTGADNTSNQPNATQINPNLPSTSKENRTFFTRKILPHKNICTQTPITINDDDNWNKIVDSVLGLSLQEWDDEQDTNILPDAVDFWKSTRNFYDQHMKLDLRASQLQTLLDEEIYPLWSFGWGPLPSYLRNTPQVIADLRQEQAKEMVLTLKDHLQIEAKRAKSKAQAYEKLVSGMYNDQDDKEKFPLADATAKTRELLGRDLKKYTSETAEFTRESRTLPKLTKVDIGKVCLRGPCNYSTMLQGFEPKSTRTSTKIKNKATTNAEPYPAKGRGQGRGRGRGRGGRKF